MAVPKQRMGRIRTLPVVVCTIALMHLHVLYALNVAKLSCLIAFVLIVVSIKSAKLL